MIHLLNGPFHCAAETVNSTSLFLSSLLVTGRKYYGHTGSQLGWAISGGTTGLLCTLIEVCPTQYLKCSMPVALRRPTTVHPFTCLSACSESQSCEQPKTCQMTERPAEHQWDNPTIMTLMAIVIVGAKFGTVHWDMGARGAKVKPMLWQHSVPR